ncbi:MAG: TM2 domain-containing protein, partial [Bacteroidota bacterium]|nr:TM2 domain-containing protein [Bacteroidota bacterium]MDX5431247.1 TM2 domain-containing protein [Bacteroidota bacterium]MDX5469986.1 TM2 domain-containing protein [Bacteroidota bacterium]
HTHEAVEMAALEQHQIAPIQLNEVNGQVDPNQEMEVRLHKASKFQNRVLASNPELKNTLTSTQQVQTQINETAATTAPEKTEGGGKDQLIALILCALLGGLGIHRFYLGYIGIGIIQLLTAGGCGIWFIIDLVRIITGDLKPKDGEYDKTFDDY